MAIDRGTRWGNQFRMEKDGGSYTRHGCVLAYREWFYQQVRDDEQFRERLEDLRGEVLACWCVGEHGTYEPPVSESDVGTPSVCHGEVLLEYFARTENAEDWESAVLAFATAD